METINFAIEGSYVRQTGRLPYLYSRPSRLSRKPRGSSVVRCSCQTGSWPELRLGRLLDSDRLGSNGKASLEESAFDRVVCLQLLLMMGQ